MYHELEEADAEHVRQLTQRVSSDDALTVGQLAELVQQAVRR